MSTLLKFNTPSGSSVTVIAESIIAVEPKPNSRFAIVSTMIGKEYVVDADADEIVSILQDVLGTGEEEQVDEDDSDDSGTA